MLPSGSRCYRRPVTGTSQPPRTRITLTPLHSCDRRRRRWHEHGLRWRQRSRARRRPPCHRLCSVAMPPSPGARAPRMTWPPPPPPILVTSRSRAPGPRARPAASTPCPPQSTAAAAPGQCPRPPPCHGRHAPPALASARRRPWSPPPPCPALPLRAARFAARSPEKD